jgi:hypothetical protein
MIEILKNVPIPEQRQRGRKRKHQDLYDLVAAWEVGDCVVFDFDTCNKNGLPISTRENALRHAAIKSNQKTTTRRNSAAKTISIWRIE